MAIYSQIIVQSCFWKAAVQKAAVQSGTRFPSLSLFASNDIIWLVLTKESGCVIAMVRQSRKGVDFPFSPSKALRKSQKMEEAHIPESSRKLPSKQGWTLEMLKCSRGVGPRWERVKPLKSSCCWYLWYFGAWLVPTSGMEGVPGAFFVTVKAALMGAGS